MICPNVVHPGVRVDRGARGLAFLWLVLRGPREQSRNAWAGGCSSFHAALVVVYAGSSRGLSGDVVGAAGATTSVR